MRTSAISLSLLAASCTVAPSVATAPTARSAATAQVGADCSRFVGQHVDARNIDAVMAPFEQVGVKGEFETTAELQGRQATAIDQLGSELILVKPSEGREYIAYDADRRVLKISRFALHNTGLNEMALFGPGAPYEALVRSRLSSYGVVLSQDESVVGAYEASNAFGASATVLKVRRTTKGVYDRPADIGAQGLFPSADTSADHIAIELPLDPMTAQRLISNVRFAYLVEPRTPYFLSAAYGFPSTPTLSDPREVIEDVSVIYGDLQCAFVLDDNDTVLAATPTR